MPTYWIACGTDTRCRIESRAFVKQDPSPQQRSPTEIIEIRWLLREHGSIEEALDEVSDILKQDQPSKPHAPIANMVGQRTSSFPHA